jgi:uncharacterized phage protein (TIGR01671 family)
MPREIKFRGYDIDTKKWYYGGYVKFDKVMLCMASEKEVKENEEHLILFQGFSDWNLPQPRHMADVDSESVGQYTDLKDTHGKEIYQGDLVKIDGIPYEVYRHESGSWDAAGKSLWTWINDDEKRLEIIGNTYENLELLEG